MRIVLHSQACAPARSKHQAFPITSRDWSDTWKHICYYLLQPFGNDITQIRGAGKYCCSFIIPAIRSLVISEKFPGQWDYVICLPSLYLFPAPHRYPCQNGTLRRGVSFTRVSLGSSFSPLANAKLPPSPKIPRNPGGQGAPAPHACWPRSRWGPTLLSGAGAAKSSQYGDWEGAGISNQAKAKKESLLQDQLGRDFIPALNLKDGSLLTS